jgi:hypothetical protein
MKQLRNLDWEAIAGVAAACVALVLHLLHVADEGVLLAIALVILALLLLRDLRRENRDEEESSVLSRLNEAMARLEAAVRGPEILLIGPRELRTESERFARQAQGEMLWFNVCLTMFEPQELFDVLLRPALENPRVSSVQFVLSPTERQRWQTEVVAKAAASAGAAKLREPRWANLDENISFILAANANGKPEAHVSFWGEPFMARGRSQDIPRYVLYFLAHSPLIAGLMELERGYHLDRAGTATSESKEEA